MRKLLAAMIVLAVLGAAAPMLYAQAEPGYIGFESPTVVAQEGFCAGPIVLQGQNASGVPTEVTGARYRIINELAIEVTMSSSFTMYTNAACTNEASYDLLGYSGYDQFIPDGDINAPYPLYFIPNCLDCTTDDLVVTAYPYYTAWPSVKQTGSIAGAPADFGFFSTSQSIKENVCSKAVYAELVDSGGIATTNQGASSSATVSLSGTISGGFVDVYTNSTCTTGGASATIPAGNYYKSSAPLYFKATTTGTATLKWTGTYNNSNLPSLTQTETITQ